MARMDGDGVDYIQPRVTKIAGIGAWMRVAGEASTRGIAVMPHCPYFGAGLLATLHMAAALPSESLIEHMYYDLAASPFAAAIQPQHGGFALPSGTGLGCEPDFCGVMPQHDGTNYWQPPRTRQTSSSTWTPTVRRRSAAALRNRV